MDDDRGGTMAISEEARHRMYVRLEAVLGPEEATTLMEHLPPVGWADVATKRDLDHLAAVIDVRFDALDGRFEMTEARLRAHVSDEIRSALVTQTRTMLIGNASLLAGVAAIAAILGR
jgi:hypothetical protein